MATPTSASARELALLLQHSDDPIIDQQLLGGNTQSPAIKATRHCDPTIHIVVALCLIVFLLHTFIWCVKLPVLVPFSHVAAQLRSSQLARTRHPLRGIKH